MKTSPAPLGAPEDIVGVLFDAATIAARVADLGAKITADNRGREVVLITVLRGGVFFLADLCRSIDLDVRLDFIGITAYSERAHAGGVRITKDLDEDIAGAHVIVVEDVIDTGLTLNYLMGVLRARHPASLEVAVLFDRTQRRIVDLPVRYRGFQMPDTYVAGYGFDVAGRHRALPYVGVLSDEALEGLGLSTT